MTRRITNLQTGLFLHLPLTDKWLQSTTVPSDKSHNHFLFDTVYGNDPVFSSEGMTLDGSSAVYAAWDPRLTAVGASQAFSFWFKLASTKSNGFFCTADADAGWSANDNFSILLDSTSRLRQYYFRLAYASDYIFSSQNLVTNLNTWYHLVLRDYGNGSAFYLNGEEVTTASSAYPPDGLGRPYSFLPSIDRIILGGRHYGGSWSYLLDGTLNDFRLYGNRTLSTDEITELYKRGPCLC